MNTVEELAARWREAQRVVVLTGAGLSTASGIPDFRSPGGRWERYQPVVYQDFLESEDSRREYWQYKGETWQLISAAVPNSAHLALRIGPIGDIIPLFWKLSFRRSMQPEFDKMILEGGPLDVQTGQHQWQ